MVFYSELIISYIIKVLLTLNTGFKFEACALNVLLCQYLVPDYSDSLGMNRMYRCFSCCTDGTATAVLLCTITIVNKVREEGLFGTRLQYTTAAAFDIHRVQHILVRG